MMMAAGKNMNWRWYNQPENSEVKNTILKIDCRKHVKRLTSGASPQEYIPRLPFLR
jgi:hypothetical protein